MCDGFSNDNIVKIKLSRQTYVNLNIADSILIISILGKPITSLWV